MTRVASMLLAGAALAAFGGCNVLPVYQPAAGAKTAPVQLDQARGGKTACVAGQPYRLEPDDKGNVNLPLGERITLQSNFSWAGGNMTYSCHPATSFVPREGQAYTMIFEIEPENHSCTFRPYRQTTGNRIGLDFDPTIGPAQACRKP
ncbi:MAG TPA: hypothetical protein VIN75_26310 [Burkholderiaceae bacterium]